MKKKKYDTHNEYIEREEEGKVELKVVERTMTFDVYFQGLIKTKSSILAHHKAPMKSFAEAKGLKEASKEEFDKLFENY